MTDEIKKRVEEIDHHLELFGSLNTFDADFLLSTVKALEREKEDCYTERDPFWVAAQEIKSERDDLQSRLRAAEERGKKLLNLIHGVIGCDPQCERDFHAK